MRHNLRVAVSGAVPGVRLSWLFIIGLAVWIFLQDRRVKALETRVRDLANRPLVSTTPVSPAATPPLAAPVSPPPAPASEPAVPVAPTYRPAFVPQAAPAAFVVQPPSAPAQIARPITPRPAYVPPPPSSFTAASASTWLAENGLAWLGGGGLALGGLLLVVLAAQRGVFTPPFRIVAAAILGLAMVAASEWIRRQNDAPGGRHALAAAASAGAGAVTLYGAVWAAHVLYGLIPLPIAAGLAVAISGGLLGLSLLHGEPLALLALCGAFLTPAMTGARVWPPLALEAYLLMLGATGATLNALHRWARAGAITLAGLLLWTFVALADHRGGDTIFLLAAALAGPVAAALWRRRIDKAAPATIGGDFASYLPMIALIAASVWSLGLWALGGHHVGPQVLATVFSGLLVAAGAAMIVARLAPAGAFAAPVVVAILGLLLSLGLRRTPVDGPPALPLILGLVTVIAACGLGAGLRLEAKARTMVLAIAAIGAAVLASLAQHGLGPLPDLRGAQLCGLATLLLAAGGGVLARHVETPRRDLGLGLWIAATAELLFLTVHLTVPHNVEPVAQAFAALALAFAADRLAWRGLAGTAVAGGLIGLATLLRPSLVADAWSGHMGLLLLALVTAATAGVLFAASRIVGRRGDHRNEAEAVATAALLALLTGLFLMLHAGLARLGHATASTNALLEAALRTALVLAAGLLLTVRAQPDDGPIARWRLIVLTGLGVIHGILTAGLVLNPWWGLGDLVGGLPVLNDLLLIFLAPALLLAAIVWKRPDSRDGWTRGAMVAAVVFGLLWVLMTLRQAFHGREMHDAPLGRAEACAYTLLALLTARAFLAKAVSASRAAWLAGAAPVFGWIALAAAGLVFGWLASPWWGPFEAPLTSTGHAVLVLALYAAGAGAAASLRRGDEAFARAALCVAVGVLFAFVTLLIRFAFHGVDMRQGLDRGGLETWTFSAVWAAFGLVVLFRGSARKDVALRWLGLAVLLATAAKVLLFDMSTLDGVVRAASFLAVGALFIGGALVVRRLNAGAKTVIETPPEDSQP